MGPLVGIQVPSNWSTAGITFQNSTDGGVTFGEVWDLVAGDLAIVSLAGGTLTYNVALDPARLRGLRAIKVRSGTLASPVPQTNQVTLQLILRQVF
jgi:hypothetical protein